MKKIQQIVEKVLGHFDKEGDPPMDDKIKIPEKIKGKGVWWSIWILVLITLLSSAIFFKVDIKFDIKGEIKYDHPWDKIKSSGNKK